MQCRGGIGLKGGQDGGLGGFVDLGDGGEIAELWVGDELFDGLVLVLGFACFRKVEAGDLETVEQQPGRFGVEAASGDALQDFGDGGQDGAAVFERGKLKFRGAHAVDADIVRGAAGGVVVVAEVFAAQRWAAAAVTVDEDVAAFVAPGCFGHCLGDCLYDLVWDLVWHGGTPPVLKVLKSSKERVYLWTSGRPWLNAKARLETGPFIFAPLS